LHCIVFLEPEKTSHICYQGLNFEFRFFLNIVYIVLFCSDHFMNVVAVLSVGEESSCSICLCRFEESEDAKILPCHHMFHTLCIQTWLNKVSAKYVFNFIFIQSSLRHTASAVAAECVAFNELCV